MPTQRERLPARLENEERRSGGFFGCFGRSRKKKNKTVLLEIQEELHSLRELRQIQADEVSRMQQELERVNKSKVELMETDLVMRQNLGETQLENKTFSITIEGMKHERRQLEEDIEFLTESLKLCKVDNGQLRRDRDVFNGQIQDLRKQLLLTQENLELMTISFQKSQNKVEALEELKLENEGIIQHLHELKSHLAKNCAEKDIEIENLKALFERDRRAFQSVREYQLEGLGRLKHKYHNSLMYLWEMSRKCDCDCKEAWVNPGNTFKPINYPEDVSLSLDFDSFLKGCNGLTTEPNLTILNTTVTSYEHELYRYRKMNEMLEDQIKEYESDYTTSSSSLKVSEESSEDILSSLRSSLQDDLSSLHVCASSSQELESLEIGDLLCDLNHNNTIKKVKFLE